MSHEEQEALRARILTAASLGNERCNPRLLLSMVDRTRGGCRCSLPRSWQWPAPRCFDATSPRSQAGLHSCCRLAVESAACPRPCFFFRHIHSFHGADLLKSSTPSIYTTWSRFPNAKCSSRAMPNTVQHAMHHQHSDAAGIGQRVHHASVACSLLSSISSRLPTRVPHHCAHATPPQ